MSNLLTPAIPGLFFLAVSCVWNPELGQTRKISEGALVPRANMHATAGERVWRSD
jgi:hypothetical protein